MKKTYWRTFNVLGTQVGIATELKTTLSVAIEATEQVSIRNSQLYESFCFVNIVSCRFDRELDSGECAIFEHFSFWA